MTDTETALPCAAGIQHLAAALWPNADGPRRIAVVGASKNAGKTTAMLAIAAAARVRGWQVGLLTIGVDGEQRDAWLDFAKPRVTCEQGAWVVTAWPWIAQAGQKLADATDLGFGSALGPTGIARIRTRCAVQLGGIAHRGQLRRAVQALAARADVVIVDGAYHRQAAAHPDIADAVVVAVGALAGSTGAQAIAASMPTLRALAARPAASGDRTPVVAAAGALTDALVADHPDAGTFRTRDASRVLLSAAGWQALDRMGAQAVVESAIPLAVIVSNPFRPDSQGEDARWFCGALADAARGVGAPIVDVVAGLRAGPLQELATGPERNTIACAAPRAGGNADA
ncbi:MAG: hypothetical protein FJ100_12920 [Deltaproteobacteria bacterium]|nr:hypothetical protein [Deltaproteobacteria bacterium]